MLPRDDFAHKKQAAWSHVYLEGLLQDGDRKSIEPLAGRVTLPPYLDVKDPEQALQQFVNQSPWNDDALARRYRQHMAQTFASRLGISKPGYEPALREWCTRQALRGAVAESGQGCCRSILKKEALQSSGC